MENASANGKTPCHFPQQEAAVLLKGFRQLGCSCQPFVDSPLPKMETQHGLPVTPGFNQLRVWEHQAVSSWDSHSASPGEAVYLIVSLVFLEPECRRALFPDARAPAAAARTDFSCKIPVAFTSLQRISISGLPETPNRVNLTEPLK